MRARFLLFVALFTSHWSIAIKDDATILMIYTSNMQKQSIPLVLFGSHHHIHQALLFGILRVLRGMIIRI